MVVKKIASIFKNKAWTFWQP